MIEVLGAELTCGTTTDIEWSQFDLANCTRCGLCKTRKNVVPPKIVRGSKILFIAESPGATEDVFGTEPLIGEAGMLFNKYLEIVGLNRANCSITNINLCHPPENRLATKEEIEACSPILKHTIEQVNPEIIVPLGNVALKAITSRSGITKYNGHVLTSDEYPNKQIVPVVHPSFALRDPKNEEALQFGLSRVKALADGAIQAHKISDVFYVDTYEKFEFMMEDLSSKPVFATDIETSSLNWVDGYIVCISFATTAGKSYTLPWIIGDEQFYDFCRRQIIGITNREFVCDITKFCSDFGLKHPEFFWKGTDVKERIKGLMANPKISKVLHNYAFDYKFLETNDLKIEGTIYDTMILHHLLDEKRGTHGLKNCALVYTEYGQYEESLKKSIKITQEGSDSYALIPLDILSPYAGTDADVTIQLYNLFMPKIEQQGFLSLYLGYLVPQTKMLMEAEKEGIKIDQDYLNNCEKILKAEIEKLDALLNVYTKDYIYEIKELNEFKQQLTELLLTPISEELSEAKKARKVKSLEKKILDIKPGINYSSGDQLRAFLFGHLGLNPQGKTDGGKYSTDESVLEVLAKQSDFAHYLLRRRKLTKILETYVSGNRDFIWKDGKVHPTFLNIGTETGRLSANKPNIQNQPRNPSPGDLLFDLGIKVRDLFIIDDPEFVLVETDYSQAELRLIAEYSRDKNLYNAFVQGRDPHAELAVRIYHKDRIPEMLAGKPAKEIVTDEERQKAKTANFSLVYGKAPENFAKENNLSLDDAVHIHHVYWDTYQDIRRWQNEEILKGRTKLYFESYFGRRRRLPKIVSQDMRLRAEGEREGINFIIQSQASDYMLYASIQALKLCKELGYDVRPLFFVHDSGVFKVHKSILQEFMTLLKRLMLSLPGLTIPMDAEFKVGTRWGSLEKWHQKDGIWAKKA